MKSIKIKDFIISKLGDRIKDVNHIKIDVGDDIDLTKIVFNGELDGENKILKFKVLSVKSLLKWYEITHYDKSMDEDDRARTRVDYPIEESVAEHYPQVFNIDGQEYRVQFKTECKN